MCRRSAASERDTDGTILTSNAGHMAVRKGVYSAALCCGKLGRHCGNVVERVSLEWETGHVGQNAIRLPEINRTTCNTTLLKRTSRSAA